MILVATQVLAVAAQWLNFDGSLSLRSAAAIPVFSLAAVWLLAGQYGRGNARTAHFSPLNNQSGRSAV
jgi:hypothetical protein